LPSFLTLPVRLGQQVEAFGVDPARAAQNLVVLQPVRPPNQISQHEIREPDAPGWPPPTPIGWVSDLFGLIDATSNVAVCGARADSAVAAPITMRLIAVNIVRIRHLRVSSLSLQAAARGQASRPALR
jgi:hypothetical protein